MKTIICIFVCILIMSGCVYHGPAVSKSSSGNLEVNVLGKDIVYNNAELYVDGNFIGNVTKDLPVLHIRRGMREVRIEVPGFKPYEKHIVILGQPNHQVINAFIEKK